MEEAKDRRFPIEYERQKEGERDSAFPSPLPSHYATFSLRVTESIRSGQESAKCGICYACKFNDVNI